MPVPRHILPPNSTPLEIAVDTTLPRGWDAMAAAAEPAATAQNDALLPWLVQHWQLGRFDSLFANKRELLAEGLPWLRERGTAAAVRRAMRWLGYTSIAIDMDGARMHLNPGREVSAADIARIAGVVRASVPLHVAFRRVYYRYDLRALRFDRKPRLDAAVWDNDSGAPVDVGEGTPIIASQLRITSDTVQPTSRTPICAATTDTTAARLRRADSIRLDVWRTDSRVRRPLGAGTIETTAAQAPQYIRITPQDAWGDVFAGQATTRPAQAQEATTETTAETVQTRDGSGRTWRGKWDATPWRVTTIREKTTELME